MSDADYSINFVHTHMRIQSIPILATDTRNDSLLDRRPEMNPAMTS